MTFETQSVPLIARLESRKNLPPLSPAHIWHPGLDAEIAALPEADLAAGRPDGELSAPAWKAALHLWNDSLEAAHSLIEHLDTQTGSAVHGIIHRREGDYDNARYWVRRTGDHPAYHSLQIRVQAQLRQQRLPAGAVGEALAAMIGQGSWNPYLFTNVIEIQETRSSDDTARHILEQLQQLELEAMLRYLVGRVAVDYYF
ncbi:hypothetical protein [Cohnella kolymensis]|uniref:hypothetical protein n=1 Tax=Cohnella kolymensis TaxID=1590652 RepID=UPI000698A6B1|nr:hypothetical protein [Cohnella kolymensis]